MRLVILLLTCCFLNFAHGRSQFTLPDAFYTLTIHTLPKNASIKIMNIKPVYYDGIQLKTGDYQLEIFAKGYEIKQRIISINHKNKDLFIKLKKVFPVHPKNKKIAKKETLPSHPTQTLDELLNRSSKNLAESLLKN